MSASPVLAQLTPTSDINQVILGEGVENFNEYPGGEFQATSVAAHGSAVFELTGDAVVGLDPSPNVGIYGWQQFESGSLPTELSPEMTLDFKVVNAGGPNDDTTMNTSIVPSLFIWESDAFDVAQLNFADLGPLVALYGYSYNIQGNGWEVFGEAPSFESYVLATNRNYTFRWGFYVISYDTLQEGQPYAEIVLEGGGITNFDGIAFDLNAHNVPEPATLALLGSGLLSVVCRRRR